MKKDIEIVSRLLVWFVYTFGLFKIAEGAFWLMNARSTLYNTAGLLICLLLAASLYLFIIHKIKK